MLLRMYLRWAETGGFQTELVEASPGEEAGLKSATFTVEGRERVRPLQGRARRPPARPAEPVRQRPPARTPPSRRSSSRRSCPTRRRRDRRGRPADRHLPRLGRRRAARQQDRLRRPDHAPADRDRRPVPERALADLEQADGAADPEVAARRAPGGGARGRARQGARRSAGHRLRESNPELRAPALPAREGPPHRLRGGQRQGVLDGNLDGFVREYLLAKAAGKGCVTDPLG